MLELIMQPAQLLWEALSDKTPSQLIDIIQQSLGTDSNYSVSIHETAVDMLLSKYPQDYMKYMHPSFYSYETDAINEF